MGSEIRTGIRLTGDASGMTAAFASGEQAVKKLNQEVDRASQGGDRLASAIKTVGHYGSLLVAATAGWNLAKQVAQTADEMTNLQSRLKLVTGSALELTYVQGRLFDIAQQSRVRYSELGSTYAQIARATSELGLSQERLLGVTQSIGQAMAISGGSAQSMQAALVQLSQGLASGTLRGEELNSILEQTPRLAQAIAEGMGVSLGQLRALGQDGKLTALTVVQALEKAAPSLKREFDQVAVTVGGAFTVLKNSSSNFIAEFDKATGSSRSVAESLKKVADGLDGVAASISNNKEAWSILGASASWAIGLGGAALALGSIGGRVAALGAVLAANPAVAALMGLGAAVGAAYSGVQSAFNSKAGLEFSIDMTERRIKGAEAALARLQAMPAPETGHETGTLAQRQAQREAAHARNLAELRERIATERANLAAFQAKLADKNKTESDPTHDAEDRKNLAPFPGAKPLEEVRKYGKLALDVQREAYDQSVEIAKSYQNRMKLAASDEERLALKREMNARLVQVDKDAQREIKGINEQGAAEAKALNEAQFAQRKASLELMAGAERYAINERTRSNEQFYRLGLLSVEEYYQRKSALELADLDISQRLTEAELQQARAVAASARKADDKLQAQARVLGLERELVELAGKRRAAEAMPGEQRDLREFERQAQIREEIFQSRRQSAVEGYNLADQMDAQTRQYWAVGSVRDPMRQLKAQLDEEIRLRREAMDKIVDADAREKATISFNDWVVARNNELAERLKPGYQKMLDEWADATRLMRETYNAAMEGMLRSGEDEFARSGGNLVSMTRAIGAQIEQEMLRAVYRKHLAGMVSSVGGSVLSSAMSFLGLDSGFGGEMGAGMRANEADLNAQTGLTPSAKGNVFTSPSLSAYSNGVYDTPHMFAFAKGAGLFAEAGPEAIMPLTRMGDGNLGVRADFGGAPTLNVTVINNTGSPVSARQKPGGNGMDMELVIDALDAGLADRIDAGSGKTARALEGRYGLATRVA